MEGAIEKILQFKMPLKSVHNKNFSFNQQKCIYGTPWKG